MSPRFSRIRILLILLCFTLCLTACGQKPSPAVQDTPTAPLETATPTPTLTPEPSPTPIPPGILWVVPPAADMFLVAQLKPVLEELAARANLQLWQRETLDPASLGAEVRAVLLLPPDPGAAALAKALPNLPFLAIGIPALQAGGNLSVIASPDSQPDQQGFLAGYIAAVVTRDWRAGVISRGDTPAGQASMLSFKNGLVFYCGLCRPAVPPFQTYPVMLSLPAGAGEAEYQAAVESLVASGVKTVYVAPSVFDPPLLQAIASKGLALIAQGKPLDGLEASWVTSVNADLSLAIQQVWDDWIAGKPDMLIYAPIGISYANPALFSPGRQDFVLKLQADLHAGFIDTGVDPLTGLPTH